MYFLLEGKLEVESKDLLEYIRKDFPFRDFDFSVRVLLPRKNFLQHEIAGSTQ